MKVAGFWCCNVRQEARRFCVPTRRLVLILTAEGSELT